MTEIDNAIGAGRDGSAINQGSIVRNGGTDRIFVIHTLEHRVRRKRVAGEGAGNGKGKNSAEDKKFLHDDILLVEDGILTVIESGFKGF